MSQFFIMVAKPSAQKRPNQKNPIWKKQIVLQKALYNQ